MEEHIAILLADLSGYTALTEMHGASSAADVIDQYLEIVVDSLIGDSVLKERTGDEVMIVSSSPDHLLATALQIIKRTANEHHFLQLHGGLHYGKVLKRKNSYFGAALNCAARIAAKATPGTFWCSEDFAQSLTNKGPFTLLPKGKHRFKNMAEEMIMLEVVTDSIPSFMVDPVCRMQIVDTVSAVPHPEKPGVFFCSQRCLHAYSAGY